MKTKWILQEDWKDWEEGRTKNERGEQEGWRSKNQRWSKWSKTVKPMWSRRAHHALFRHKSLVFRYFLMFPDFPSPASSPRLHVPTLSSFTLPTHLPFPPFYHLNFYPTSVLHLGHLHNCLLTTRTRMSYGLSRSHASLLSGWAASSEPSSPFPRHSSLLHLLRSRSFPPFLRTQSSSSTRHKSTTVSVD